MKKILLNTLFTACLLSVRPLFVLAQAPVFNSATPNSATIARYDKFEVVLSLTASYTNPYDYDDIVVSGTFTSPSGKNKTVDGFFMQDYATDASGNLTAVGSGVFKIRFAPDELGTWTYIISCTNRNGSATLPAKSFSCQSSTAAGFIRKNASNYLSFDNGNQFIPIGEDMCWQTNNAIVDYPVWGGKLAANGGNFIRIWMADFTNFGLEWKNGNNGYEGLKKYRQANAYYLDWLLDFCKQKDLYMMLCLVTHGTVSTTVNPQWQDNPYNAANGGPCQNTWDFFTNATAKDLIKNRFRYIVARYGYSKNVQSWELFNEVDWTDQFATRKGDVTAWHDEMAKYFRAIDVNKHLVTTSYAIAAYDSATWKLPSIDFTQTHYYVRTPAIEKVLTAGVQDYLSNYGKPTINGEFGLEHTRGEFEATQDSAGIHVHNGIWATMFGGGMGPGMTWWWDSYVEPKNLYYHYKPLANLVKQIKFKDDNYKPASAFTTGGGYGDVVIPPGYQNYNKCPASDFTIDAAGNMTPNTSSLGQVLFGTNWNSESRNPPTFHVNYPFAGQFKLTTGTLTSAAPIINIYLDGVQMLSVPGVVATTYSINVPPGRHSIKVDNSGFDWITISSYNFTNIGSPISSYVLQSGDKTKAAGYVLNNKYNWEYWLTSLGTPPPPVNGSSITIPSMKNGTYLLSFYDCSTGNVVFTSTATASDSTLSFTLPTIAWDISFTATLQNQLPIIAPNQSFPIDGGACNVVASIAASDPDDDQLQNWTLTGGTGTGLFTIESNTGRIVIANPSGIDFTKSSYTLLVSVSDGMATSNVETITVTIPAAIKLCHKGSGILVTKNNVRTHLQHGDCIGNCSSATLNSARINNQSVETQMTTGQQRFVVYPNPFSNEFLLTLKGGDFIRVFDQLGRLVASKQLRSTAAQQVSINMAREAAGIYIVSVYTKNGELIDQQKVFKK